MSEKSKPFPHVLDMPAQVQNKRFLINGAVLDEEHYHLHMTPRTQDTHVSFACPPIHIPWQRVQQLYPSYAIMPKGGSIPYSSFYPLSHIGVSAYFSAQSCLFFLGGYGLGLI